MPDFAVVNLATGQSHTMAPLGALYVVAATEEAGYRVAFADYALASGSDLFDLDRIADFLATHEAPVVGISTFASMLPYALGALHRLRERFPERKTVLGGPGPSAAPSAILERFPEVDFIVKGEGEETAVDLLGTLLRGRPALDSIPGLCWRAADGTVMENPARPRRRDLDAIPRPAYHHVDLAAYDIVGVIYARGCPYACTYCDVVSMWKRRNIARSLDAVLAEIMELRDHAGIRHVAFVDDLFTVERRRVMQFCDAFEAAGRPTTWGCTTRIDRVDDELLERMAAAGCRYVFYGVESGSEKVLARVNKVIPFAQTAHAVATSVRLGMYVHTPLMWGFPFEEIRDFRQTVAFGKYLTELGAHVFYTLATPLPATALCEEYRDRLRFDEHIYSTIIAPGRVTDLASVADLIRAHPAFLSGFYHFADGQVEEKIEIGRRAGLDLSDIRISNLRAESGDLATVTAANPCA